MYIDRDTAEAIVFLGLFILVMWCMTSGEWWPLKLVLVISIIMVCLWFMLEYFGPLWGFGLFVVGLFVCLRIIAIFLKPSDKKGK